MTGPEHARIVAVLALIALTVTVVLGWATAARVVAPRHRRALVRCHQRSAIGGVALAGLHVPAALASTSPLSPAAVVAGAVALAVVIALPLAWRLRRRLPRALQTNMHRAGYAVVPVVALHALMSHPGPMAPGEPLLYGAALAIVAMVGISRAVARPLAA